MVKKQFILATLLFSGLMQAAASSSQDAQSHRTAHDTRLHRFAVQAVLGQHAGDRLRLDQITAYLKKTDSSVLSLRDESGFTPIDCAMHAIYTLPAQKFNENCRYYEDLLGLLLPACADAQEERALELVKDLVSADAAIHEKALEEFYDASPEFRKIVLRRYYYEAGHFLEPFLEACTAQELLNRYIVPHLSAEGEEKVYYAGLLKYMLSPLYKKHKSIPRQAKNMLLAMASLYEKSLPSVIPDLIRAGAQPTKSYAMENIGDISALQCVLSRLEYDAPGRQIACKHLLQMISALSEDQPDVLNEEFKAAVGASMQHFSAEDYMNSWSVILKIVHLLGADLETYRLFVFPFLKKEITTQDEYLLKKEAQNPELTDFEKITLACLIHEFCYVVSSSLSGYRVYDLFAYIRNGEAKIVPQEQTKVGTINAERIRKCLSIDALKLVERI